MRYLNGLQCSNTFQPAQIFETNFIIGLKVNNLFKTHSPCLTLFHPFGHFAYTTHLSIHPPTDSNSIWWNLTYQNPTIITATENCLIMAYYRMTEWCVRRYFCASFLLQLKPKLLCVQSTKDGFININMFSFYFLFGMGIAMQHKQSNATLLLLENKKRPRAFNSSRRLSRLKNETSGREKMFVL